MSREEKDEKNKRAGIFISIGTHIAVILLFIFLVAWRAPNPPLPEFGIELNFGTSDLGTGDVQPETTPAVAETEEEAMPDTPEELAEEIIEETIETPVEETTEVTDAFEEEIVPVTEQETEAPVKEPEKKAEEVTPKVVEEKKEDPKPPKVLYPGKKDGAAGTTGEAKDPANANQGDKIDAKGDQGDEKGSVDARSLYGESGGGGGGTELNINGWNWNREPRPEHDNVKFDGKITFDFQVDEKGNVTSVSKIPPSTVSASLIQLYQDELFKTTFSPIGSGTPPSLTKGRVTFIIKAK